MNPTGPTSTSISTEQLARQARAGCRESFEALVRRYAAPLQDFLRMRGGAGAEVEDLAQESFLAAWQEISRYDERWSFTTWLFTLAHRRGISRWRRRRPETVPEEVLDRRARGRDPSELASLRERKENLWELAREVLPAPQRAALWLTYAEGADTGEIARILGRARPTVRVLLFRARRTLERHLRARLAESAASAAGQGDSPSAVILGGES